jgi:hypothetical protein
VLSHVEQIPDIARRIVRAEVPCLSFESLCRRYGVERVDLLAIDAEGYDREILRQIDFDVYRPRLLIYEHYHFRREDRAEARSRLEQLGYATMEEGFDTWCVDARVGDAVTRAFRRLRPGLPGTSVEEEAEAVAA